MIELSGQGNGSLDNRFTDRVAALSISHQIMETLKKTVQIILYPSTIQFIIDALNLPQVFLPDRPFSVTLVFISYPGINKLIPHPCDRLYINTGTYLPCPGRII